LVLGVGLLTVLWPAGASIAGGSKKDVAATDVAATGKAPTPVAATSVKDAWLALANDDNDTTATGSGCADDLIFDYGKQGGMRNFFCRTLTFFSWKTFLSLAPVKPFRAGPHRAGKLALNSERDFGRYEPKFVRWAVDALIPGASDDAFRRTTQAAYDFQIRDLARTWYQVWRTIHSDKAWLNREMNTYLRAADDKSVGWDSEVVALYHDVMGTADNQWGGFDPNLVRSATTYWLRREKDGTAALWAEGLEKLLNTYDKPWLDEMKNEMKKTPGTRPLPQRSAPNPLPDYR
jgi:hypothetical protein